MIDEDREWLDSGDRDAPVRPEIANSWRRCQLNKVDPEGITMRPGAASPDSKIARVATPILNAMADVMVGANTSLLLSAPDGTMLWRWAEDSRLSKVLDRSWAVVGTQWSEDVVGTNGIGTSLETSQPITISGVEHFTEALHPFTCAAAPIRNPITRRVAGTLSVTSLVEHSSPLMAATLKKLTREIEEQLYGESTLRERELLHQFLAERRRGHNAVVAVNDDTVIANKAGAKLQIDGRTLWNRVQTGQVDTATRELESLEWADGATWRTIEQAGSVVGLVIVADSPDVDKRKPLDSPPPQRKKTPRVPQWAELPTRLRQSSTGCDRIVVSGEPGVGKRTLVREAFESSSGPLPELDCAEVDEISPKRWLATARAMLLNEADEPARRPLLLSHLESLGAGTSRSLGRILDELPRREGELYIAATWTPTGEPGAALQSLLDRFSSEPFEVPPLRKRPNDVLRRLADQGPSLPVLSIEAIELAQRHPWPGNHRQLEEFRRWMGRQRRPMLNVEDLPFRWSRDAARARLTRIQAAEADAIDAALQAHDGNKAAAANSLGISRSSLYRKMREFHLI